MIRSNNNSDHFDSVGSLEEFRKLFQKKVEEHNTTPQTDFGGLTPKEALTLLYTDWKDSSCPLQRNDSLPPEAIRNTEFLKNSRLLLNYINDRKPLPTTSTGNLKRKDVGNLLNEMLPPTDDYVDQVHEMNKVINEQDVVPLHTIKTVLEIGGFLNVDGSKFRVPSRTEKLMAECQHGKLYAELFRVYFREYNIAYFTRGPKLDEIQDTIAMTLYKLQQLDDRWYPEYELTGEVAHPMVLDQYPDTDLNQTKNILPLVYSQRVFRPLERFGLLEKRKKEPVEMEYKKTSLYDRFLSFSFEKHL